MEQFKFTPAPWQFLYGRTPDKVEELNVLTPNHLGKKWQFKEIDIGTSDNRVIAKISGGTTDTHTPYEQWEANAKLLLAAPDLLQACIDVLSCLANSNHRQYERETLIRAIDKATK